MSQKNMEDIVTSLYDMVQDARSMPLAADKCVLERDKVLDMLDELITQIPSDLKESRAIVESRNEIVGQARREAESILKDAQAKARQLVTQEAIYQEARRQSQEMLNNTQAQIAELRRASNEYMDDALRRTEESIAASLSQVRDTRVQFRALIEAQGKRPPAAVPQQPQNPGQA